MKTAVKKGICTADETMNILGIKKGKFQKIKKDPNTRLRQSHGVTGKYIYSSVRAEFKRLHGYSYQEAI